jgi:hypothetical protein
MPSLPDASEIVIAAIIARHGLVAGSCEVHLEDVVHQLVSPDARGTIFWASYVATEEHKPFPVAYGAVRAKFYPIGIETRFAWFDMALGAD